MKKSPFSKAAVVGASPIESLERRELFATGPALVGEHLIGPVGGVTSIVLQFNTHLNPASATDPKAYAFGKHTSSNDSGSFLDGFNPFSPFITKKSSGKATPFATAGTVTYDDATETVTLSPKHPFPCNVFFRYLKINGNGQHALLGADGLAFNGGHTQVTHFKIRRNDQLRYMDPAKNQVTLTLRGPGRIVSLFRRGTNPMPIVYLDNTNASSSVLTGTVKAGKKGTGVTTLQEVSGFSIGQINLPSSFTVQFAQ